MDHDKKWGRTVTGSEVKEDNLDELRLKLLRAIGDPETTPPPDPERVRPILAAYLRALKRLCEMAHARGMGGGHAGIALARTDRRCKAWANELEELTICGRSIAGIIDAATEAQIGQILKLTSRLT
jgi:hypothetical protein